MVLVEKNLPTNAGDVRDIGSISGSTLVQGIVISGQVEQGAVTGISPSGMNAPQPCREAQQEAAGGSIARNADE